MVYGVRRSLLTLPLISLFHYIFKPLLAVVCLQSSKVQCRKGPIIPGLKGVAIKLDN
jgi:hypothetical protein